MLGKLAVASWRLGPRIALCIKTAASKGTEAGAWKRVRKRRASCVSEGEVDGGGAKAPIYRTRPGPT